MIHVRLRHCLRWGWAEHSSDAVVRYGRVRLRDTRIVEIGCGHLKLQLVLL